MYEFFIILHGAVNLNATQIDTYFADIVKVSVRNSLLRCQLSKLIQQHVKLKF